VNTIGKIGSNERVSHLSYEDLGNGLEATKHEGYRSHSYADKALIQKSALKMMQLNSVTLKKL
jgi:hypothetical protein